MFTAPRSIVVPCVLITLAGFCLAATSQKEKKAAVAAALLPVWEISDGMAQPESAHYCAESGLIYVSNVAGDAVAKDGDGWITSINRNGKVVTPRFTAEGLNAPKGLFCANSQLWIADIDQVVAVALKTGTVTTTIRIPGAVFLNDLVVTAEGTIYVSDTVLGKIFKVEEGNIDVFAASGAAESPNGLAIVKSELVVAGWGVGTAPDLSTKTPGRLFAYDLTTKKQRIITPKPLGHLDGIEPDGKGGYIVSDWVAGNVFTVTKEGVSRLVLSAFKGAADIGFIASTRLLIVPRMGENKVSAYVL